MAWRKLSLRFARGLSTISRVGVVGGGQMGSGIAYVSAVNAKIPVVVVDQSEEACKVRKGRKRAELILLCGLCLLYTSDAADEEDS
eukprot:948050-Amorphochlora_amoeboformis.AAC.2